EWRAHYGTRAGRALRREGRAHRGAVIAEDVLADQHVVRGTGTQRNEGRHANAQRRLDIAEQGQVVARIQAGTAVIQVEVVRIGRRAWEVFRILQLVGGVDRDLARHLRVHAEHHDLLVEAAAGFIFVELPRVIAVGEDAIGSAERQQRIKRSRKRRIDRDRLV